ncbi:hypothetical protein H9P43_009238 [Blastocladiella emersonii ATCC 22665]|nr:hypothetical protein H9P43_009238 [Blastocladiella emersonii ATCC 22665]
METTCTDPRPAHLCLSDLPPELVAHVLRVAAPRSTVAAATRTLAEVAANPTTQWVHRCLTLPDPMLLRWVRIRNRLRAALPNHALVALPLTVFLVHTKMKYARDEDCRELRFENEAETWGPCVHPMDEAFLNRFCQIVMAPLDCESESGPGKMALRLEDTSIEAPTRFLVLAQLACYLAAFGRPSELAFVLAAFSALDDPCPLALSQWIALDPSWRSDASLQRVTELFGAAANDKRTLGEYLVHVCFRWSRYDMLAVLESSKLVPDRASTVRMLLNAGDLLGLSDGIEPGMAQQAIKLLSIMCPNEHLLPMIADLGYAKVIRGLSQRDKDETLKLFLPDADRVRDIQQIFDCFDQRENWILALLATCHLFDDQLLPQLFWVLVANQDSLVHVAMDSVSWDNLASVCGLDVQEIPAHFVNIFARDICCLLAVALSHGIQLADVLNTSRLAVLRDLKLLDSVLAWLATYVGPVAVFRAYDEIMVASLEHLEHPQIEDDFGVSFSKLLVALLALSPTRELVLEYLNTPRHGTKLPRAHWHLHMLLHPRIRALSWDGKRHSLLPFDSLPYCPFTAAWFTHREEWCTNLDVPLDCYASPDESLEAVGRQLCHPTPRHKSWQIAWRSAVHAILTELPAFTPTPASFPEPLRRQLFSSESLIMADFVRSDDRCNPRSHIKWIVKALHRAAPELLVNDLLRVGVASSPCVWRIFPYGALDGLRSPLWLLAAACVVLDRYGRQPDLRNKVLGELFDAAEATACTDKFEAMIRNECQRRGLKASQFGI